MRKITLDDIRSIPDFPQVHQFGFLAARAMPDGALAVAMKLGSSIQIMRMYIRSLDQEIELGYNSFQLPGDRLPTHLRSPWRDQHSAKMDFAVTDCIVIAADAWDEYAYHQQIPQYKEIPPMEMRLLE